MGRNKSLPIVSLQCPVAYEVEINSLAMRNALVKNGVSFMDMPEIQSALKSEIASKLNLTKILITRATDQLKEMVLILQSNSGTEIL